MSASPHVLHLGPDPAVPGGIGSVMRVLQAASPGTARIAPTWAPGTRRAQLRLAARAAVTVARAPRSTVIHVHMAADGSVVRKGLLLVVARSTGHVAVATVHGSRFEAFAQRHPWITGAALRRASALFVLSPGLLGVARRLAPAVPATQVVNPVEVDETISDAGARPPVVAFVGEVGRRKGADVLLAAWPRVSAAVPGAQLHVMGLRGDVVVPPVVGVTVLGPVPRAEVRARLRNSRVVALPSRAEALPMALLEGLASGTPFVATDVGDIAHLAGSGGGALVPVDDAAALASALVEALSDDAAATRSGRAGWAACQAEFGAERVAAELSAAYPAQRRGRWRGSV